MSIVNLSYNSYNLQTTTDLANTIMSRDILHRHLGNKNIILRSDTIRDGFDVVSVNYSQKLITVRGLLKSNSVANLRILRDAFMNALRPNEKNLDINDGSGTIRYNASVQSVDIPEEFWNITTLPFSIEFLAQPFAKATSYTSVTLGTNEGADFSHTFTVTGTYKTKPTITFVVDDGDNLNYIELENGENLDWIRVAKEALPTDLFIDGDHIEINCENETVRILRAAAWTNVDFTGIFPYLIIGSNKLNITLNKNAAVQVDASLIYYPTYL